MNRQIPFEAFDRNSIPNLEDKLKLARSLAEQVEPGQTIGAGSGSTAFLAVHAIADRVAAGEVGEVTLIPTSLEVHLTITNLGLTSSGLSSAGSAGTGLAAGDLFALRPDWLFDGTDEVDPDGNLIKGRGGALFREKILFRATTDRRVLIDKSKRVERLGERYPIPVEVVPSALPVVFDALNGMGATETVIRTGTGKDGPVITESGNLLLDCRFSRIDPGLEREIKQITGVVESGLFQGYGPTLISR